MIDRPVIIVGMHRSGTSCLAGSLEQCGLYLGDVNRSAPFNLRGNCENERIRELHDRILARNDCRWDIPPTSPIIWTEDEKADVSRLISQEYGAHAAWGFKDPRTLFLLDGWLELFPNLRLVGTVRPPSEVAASLLGRDQFDQLTSLSLWRSYNWQLAQAAKQFGMLVVRYDLNPCRYQQRVRQVAKRLGLDADSPLDFRTEHLRHHDLTDDVEGEAGVLWNQLCELATE